jgi:hypothetical protein
MNGHLDSTPDPALQLLAKAARALQPYGDQLVIAGGLVPLLYRSLPQFRQLDWQPLRTFDVDLTLPREMSAGQSAPQLLQAAGIVCVHGFGTDGPGAEFYQDAAHGSARRGPVYLEFLTSKKGDRSADFRTLPVGLRVQTLRYLDLLRIEPLHVNLQCVPQARVDEEIIIHLPQPVTFVLQKPLIRNKRSREKQPKDMAYVYDVIMLSQNEWPAGCRIVEEIVARGGEHAVWVRKGLNELKSLFASPTAAGVMEAQQELAAAGSGQPPSALAICEIMREWLATMVSRLSEAPRQ